MREPEQQLQPLCDECEQQTATTQDCTDKYWCAKCRAAYDADEDAA